jgi:hypothetical protein
MEHIFLGSILLLIFLIVALITIIVLRDRRELKTKQIEADLSQLSQLEEVVGELKKIKDELAAAQVSLKKHETALSQALTQTDGRLRQTSFAGANPEHRQQPAGAAGANRERQDDRRDRDRGPRQPGKGKTWGNGRPDNRRVEYSGVSGVSAEAAETVAINDGEKYAKVSELAAHGLTAQEIAKRLNVNADEISLVLELKKK